MKNKAILVSLITLVAMIFVLNTVLATTNDFITINKVKINGIVASTDSPSIGGDVSDTVPVEVYFTANTDASDVKVRVWFEGFQNDVYQETPRFLIVNGSEYVERFTIKLPSTDDLNSDLTRKLDLYVRAMATDQEAIEQDYAIEMQRMLYNLNILSVDSPNQAAPGSVVPLDVVVQNNGNSRLNNVYVTVTIPELGVSQKVYFGDMGPKEETDSNYYDNIADTVDKKVYLNIPQNSASGTYNMNIQASNYDATTSVKQKLVISSAGSQVIPTSNAKTISNGEQTTFDVVLVNPSNRMVVYTITPEAASGLLVSVEQPVVTVGADSSTSVKVDVTATSSATEGTQTILIDVSSDGTLVKQVPLTVNVQKATSSTTVGGAVISSNLVLILTVVLVIIFVVLLIVLIVLLTRKPSQTEEFGETSYY